MSKKLLHNEAKKLTKSIDAYSYDVDQAKLACRSTMFGFDRHDDY